MGSLGIHDIFFAGIYTGIILTVFYILPAILLRYFTPLQIVMVSNFVVLLLMIPAVVLRLYFGESVNKNMVYTLFVIFVANGICLMNTGNVTSISIQVYSPRLVNRAYGLSVSITHFLALAIPFSARIANSYGFNSVFGTWVIVILAVPA